MFHDLTENMHESSSRTPYVEPTGPQPAGESRGPLLQMSKVKDMKRQGAAALEQPKNAAEQRIDLGRSSIYSAQQALGQVLGIIQSFCKGIK